MQRELNLSRRTTAGVLLGVFVLSLFLGAYRPVSRPSNWWKHSNAFTAAVMARDWAGTWQQYHPGYTTMLVGATSLWVYGKVQGTIAENVFSWAVTPLHTQYGRELAAGILGLSLLIAALMVAVTLLLRKLGGWPLALTGVGLLLFSPTHLGYARLFHPDSSLSVFMLVSGLLLLIYVEERRKVYLALSGFVAGIAVMTKLPAMFLMPYMGLGLLVRFGLTLREQGRPEGDGGRAAWVAGAFASEVILPGILWLVAAIAAFAFWPAVWADPRTMFERTFGNITRHIGTGHDRRFYGGTIEDFTHPPVLFYPAVMAFHSTFVTMSLTIAGLGVYLFWGGRSRLRVKPLIFWLVVGYVFFFTLQMTIASSQSNDYILPAHLMLIILAALGAISVATLLNEVLEDRGKQLASALSWGTVATVVGLQALVALPYAPNYGAHSNHLLGGNRVAANVIEIGRNSEGIPMIASYLASLPDAENLQVGSTKPANKTLNQIFPGEIKRTLRSEDDYHVFGIGTMQRDKEPERWEGAWQQYAGVPPQMMVVFDGVPFAWLYDPTPPDALEPIVIRRGGGTPYIVLAWVWTVALLGTVVWALRPKRTRRVVGEPSYQPAE